MDSYNDRIYNAQIGWVVKTDDFPSPRWPQMEQVVARLPWLSNEGEFPPNGGKVLRLKMLANNTQY
jgi:hypothetical protein